MPKNPLTKKIGELESYIEGLENQIAVNEEVPDGLELVLEDIEKFCGECDLVQERECPYCHLYGHYIGKK